MTGLREKIAELHYRATHSGAIHYSWEEVRKTGHKPPASFKLADKILKHIKDNYILTEKK